MKLIIVKCPKNKKVEVEDRGTGGASCPENCPLRQSSRCFNKTFRYTKPLSASVTPDIPYAGKAENAAPTPRAAAPAKAEPTSYSGTELKEPIYEPISIPDPTPKNPIYEPVNIPDPAAEAESPFGLRDLYSDSDGSTIEYSPFGDPGAVSSFSYSEPQGGNEKSTLDKYNDLLSGESSIFSAVRPRDDGEPCFVDGAFSFYERAPKGVRTAGNSRAAVRYIFNHWYVSRVFSEDSETYSEDFLYLMKLCGFKRCEDKMKEIAGDVKLTADQKFFRLFYTVVYKNQISGFYWNEGDSPFRQITPRFLSVDDFYKKLSQSLDPSDFMASFSGCFDELIYFLRSGDDSDGGRAWFRKAIPEMISERQKRFVYVSEENGVLSMINLGDARSFVSEMAKPASIEEMKRKCDFLSDFEITVNYKLMPRKKPLVLSSPSSVEDDAIYDVVGITGYTSSQCATAYNYYMTLLREYVNTFKPDSITVGRLKFTSRNFYNELLSVIRDAGAFFAIENHGIFREVKELHTVKSLFARGVFSVFEASCETTRLGELKKLFVEAKSIGIESYLGFGDVSHEVYVNNERKPVSEYISGLLSGNASYIRGALEDKILEAYLKVNTKGADVKAVSDNIKRLLAKEKELLAKF